MRIRYALTYLAAIIVALHLLVPHAHSEDLSSEIHCEIHEQQDHNILDFLSFIFHEYTEEGDMEQFVPDQDTNDVQFEHRALTSSFALFQSFEFSETPYTTYGSPQVEHRRAGFISAWGNRPPPLI